MRAFLSRRVLPAATLALGVVLAVGSAVASRSPTLPPEQRAQETFNAHVDTLQARAASLAELAASAADPAALQTAFNEARAAWKRVEFLAEHYTPLVAESVNGPPIPEVAEDDATRMVIPAEGFQVVEELLFPEVDPTRAAELALETRILAANVERLAAFAEATPLSAGNLFDAARLELLRVAALGLSGFDSPVAGRSLPEAADALRGVQRTLAPYVSLLTERDSGAATRLDQAFAGALADLDRGSDPFAFDQLAFLVDRLDPLVGALEDARVALGIELPDVPRAWRAGARSMFEPDAFDPHAFAPPGSPRPGAGAIELGRTLFHDPLLSADGSRACASCHHPAQAFSDGRVRSPAFGGAGTLERNTPTLLNAGLQRGSFADLRVAYLEDQVRAVVANPSEMRGSVDGAAQVMGGSAEYRALFQSAFGDSLPPSGDRLAYALASYVRSLSALDSPFDRYVRGDRSALDAEEKDGFNLFMGKARCGTCHFLPLFSGSVPPVYAEAEVEVLGVPARADTARAALDADEGRGRVFGNPLHAHAFRTPTVRNAGPTAPYMHNGVYRTLEDVIDFYDRGGGAGIGAALEHQTLPPDRLELDAPEKRALVAFLNALTDSTSVPRASPGRLPRIDGRPELDARPVGGGF